jgi:hypothetical protein
MGEKKELPPEETIHDRLSARLAEVTQEVEEDKLPGWNAFVVRSASATKSIGERRERLEASVRDEDEVLFTRALSAWLAACHRVNELLAEEYRAAHEDPLTWELRYIKWMKLKFIRFDSPLGEFFVVPRMPRRKPKARYWYTADEMIAMLHPTTAAAINQFKQLPARPDSLPRPADGEYHTHIDFTGAEPVVKYELPRGPRYERERVR